ncbi:AraC family transcriptional regulator [Streptomyces sp. NBC_00696]|uniref:AraC family transcriptional regulator n=1 Tax=Streptomyces sp. NBC_00696 TaxID=2903672 RepID=UPI002E368542|nr:AraC family transcriptional regulator [Streptomyces sp. NBC_00696]
MDVLHDHLMRARAAGASFARTEADPPWGVRLSGAIQLSVHAVVRGRGWLWLDHPASAVELVPGEVTLVRGGPDHCIGHEPGADCLEPEQFRARQRQDGNAAAPRATVFFCGAYRFSGDIGNGLLEALPQVQTLSTAAGDPLRDVITLLSHELAFPEPGQPTVLDRLLDVLLVHALRADFRHSPTAPRWYRASADPRLSTALQALHESPDRPWSVPELAALSGLSRAAFARVFRDTLGQTPMQYLTDWRMALAREMLRTSDAGLPGIARSVGYSSPYAFAAAFRRHHGEAPRTWQRREQLRPPVRAATDPDTPVAGLTQSQLDALGGASPGGAVALPSTGR